MDMLRYIEILKKMLNCILLSQFLYESSQVDQSTIVLYHYNLLKDKIKKKFYVGKYKI